MRILTVNGGSTSLKLERYDLTEPLAPFDDPPAPAARYDDLDTALRNTFDLVAHRFVRLPDNTPPVLPLDDATLAAIGTVSGEAPLHDAAALQAVWDVQKKAPGVAQFAVSDSAFHRTLAPAAYTYAIPRALTATGLRRRGYHGLNHEYAAHRGARQAGIDVGAARIVTLHLGGGCSLCAVRDGASIDTTMGYTPLEGVPMATRSGSVDPGLLLHLLRGGASVDDLERVLEHESGLLGISGRSGDVRDLLAARASDPDAALALDVFVWRTRTALGAMSAVLGGADLAVFTGGIGEHAAELRDAIIGGARQFGVAASCVVEARENWMLARAVMRAQVRPHASM
jgi:acetate kinase